MKGRRMLSGTVAWILALGAAVAGPVPDLVSFQGRLLHSDGSAIDEPTQIRFRVYRGGDGTTLPSTGALVYHETVVVEPDAAGIFSHYIGAGSPAGDCVTGGCLLGPATLGDGSLPVWIEVTVDPDGIVGTADDDVLLPRTRLGTVGYAYRVATLDGAEGGALSGTLSAERLEGRWGATLGDGGNSNVALVFDGGDADAALTWKPPERTLDFSERTYHASGIGLPPRRAVSFGPFSDPVPNTYVRLRTTLSTFADGNLDGVPDDNIVTGLCYNCSEGFSTGPYVSTEYAMKAQWEWTYAPAEGQRWVEHNWDFLAPANPGYRPFGFYLRTDAGGGFANPSATWTFKTDRSTAALHINQNGNVMIGGDSPEPTHRLEVKGQIHATGHVVLDDDRSLLFGGRDALDDDSAAGRLAIGDGYSSLELRTAGLGRMRFDGGRIRLGDADSGSGATLVFGSCAAVVASPVTDLDECNVASIIGAATVQRLDPCAADTRGRVIHILCGMDATVFCDGDGTRCAGGNLRLAGTDNDFSCSPDDVLTLLCDGANWRQLGVSVN